MNSKADKYPRLWACILMDLVGVASYLIPGFGEMIDVVWGPISAIVFYKWFKTPIGAIIAGSEEMLPLVDIIPTFTIAYFLLKNKKDNAKP